MHAWEQIQLTLEHIETHLSEEIAIEELANMAALSPFYYQKLFTRLVKKPVKEYIRLRRMAKAADALLKSDKRILDIALDWGFSSHEHFTRTFKETFGITPDAYRKERMMLNTMTKPELLLHYVLIDEGVPLITNGIVLEVNRQTLKEPLRFIGVRKEMPIGSNEGLGVESGPNPLEEVWNTLHENKTTRFHLEENAEEMGVVYGGDKEGFYNYFGGGLAKADTPLNGNDEWTMPAGEYVVCVFEAERFDALVSDALYKAEQYMYGIWLPGHKLETEPYCIERYETHTPETTKMEVWMKIK